MAACACVPAFGQTEIIFCSTWPKWPKATPAGRLACAGSVSSSARISLVTFFLGKKVT